jgi:hypothetical protein
VFLFESSDILDSSIRRISSHLRGPELPAEASIGEKIKAGLVVLDSSEAYLLSIPTYFFPKRRITGAEREGGTAVKLVSQGFNRSFA